jgi:transcriptional regulator with XRE-family HTH domain
VARNPAAGGAGKRELVAAASAAGEGTGLTQEALASQVSLTRTSITNIEKGRQKFLLHTLFDIASALGVPPGTRLPQEAQEGQQHLDAKLALN